MKSPAPRPRAGQNPDLRPAPGQSRRRRPEPKPVAFRARRWPRRRRRSRAQSQPRRAASPCGGTNVWTTGDLGLRQPAGLGARTRPAANAPPANCVGRQPTCQGSHVSRLPVVKDQRCAAGGLSRIPHLPPSLVHCLTPTGTHGSIPLQPSPYGTLIQRGRGTGPLKPRQPVCGNAGVVPTPAERRFWKMRGRPLSMTLPLLNTEGQSVDRGVPG